jgi:acyl carrier protein
MSAGTTIPADHTAATTAPASLLPHELELARLIVAALSLEVAADSISADAPLFHGGLGLDSIDALEISLVVSKTYGVKLRSDDERNHRIFASLRTLSAHIEKHRAP